MVDRNVASSQGWRGNYPYREAGSGSPGTIASGADDSALVNVAGADKALNKSLAHGCRRGCGGLPSLPGVNISCDRVSFITSDLRQTRWGQKGAQRGVKTGGFSTLPRHLDGVLCVECYLMLDAK